MSSVPDIIHNYVPDFPAGFRKVKEDEFFDELHNNPADIMPNAYGSYPFVSIWSYNKGSLWADHIFAITYEEKYYIKI